MSSPPVRDRAALVLVDIQNDFLPGGALAVPDGDEVLPVACALVDQFRLCVATQDWHPPDHGSFASNHPGARVGDVIMLDGLEQILWPAHCIQHTSGALLAERIPAHRIMHTVRKGTDARIDSYSGFFDNQWRKATGLETFLKDHSVRHMYVMGLATDYCVKFTALDGCKLGFDVSLILDGCRGIDQQRGDVERALRELCAAGVELTHSSRLVAG